MNLLKKLHELTLTYRFIAIVGAHYAEKLGLIAGQYKHKRLDIEGEIGIIKDS